MIDKGEIISMEPNTNMPLETEIKCSYELYKAAANTFLKNNNKRMMTIYIIDALLIILSLLLLVMGDYSAIPIVCLIVGIIYIPCFFILRSIQMKKTFKTNIALHDATVHYSFYEDAIEMTSPVTTSRIKYDAIYTTMEDDRCILLLPSAKQYFIIDKKNCSEELISFLHVKMDEIKVRKKK